MRSEEEQSHEGTMNSSSSIIFVNESTPLLLEKNSTAINTSESDESSHQTNNTSNLQIREDGIHVSNVKLNFEFVQSQESSVQQHHGPLNERESFDIEKNAECKLYHDIEQNEYDIRESIAKGSNENNDEEESENENLIRHPNDSIIQDILGKEDRRNEVDEKVDKEQPKVTYLSIVRSNKPLQLYLSSYIITQIGEWFTYVASIELIEQILGPEKSTSRKYISYLVVFRLLPFLFVTPFGGVLADVRDRRKSMITLDWIGSIIPFLYFLAAHFHSIPIVFIVSALQSTVAAFYEPCRNAIIPLLVVGDEEMQKATTLAGLVWSVMAAFGAATGGLMVSIVGIRWCFVLDSCTFACSALILLLMEGEFDASKETKEDLSILSLAYDMMIGGAKYIMSSRFWPLVFLKLTSAIIYGGADVLNVSFSEKGHENDEVGNSRRLGTLFFCVGFGCYIGPLIADNWSSMKNMNTIVNACVVAFGIQGIGLLGMSYFDPFNCICLFTIVRSAGSSIAWIDSSILLQTYSKPEMLGRVMAVDYGLALTGESLSAMLVGILQDKWGMSAMEVCLYMGYIAMFLFILWFVYRLSGPKFDQ